MTADLYEVQADPDAWYIRFYLWLYDADPDAINTCKLFWAFLLSPIFLVGRYTIYPPINWVVNKLIERDRAKFHAELEELRAVDWDYSKLSKKEGALDKFSSWISGVFARFQTVLKWGFWLFVVAYVVFCVTTIVFAFINHFWVSLTTVGIVIVFIALVSGLVVLIDRANGNPLKKFRKFFVSLGRGVHRHTCAAVKLEKEEEPSV